MSLKYKQVPSSVHRCPSVVHTLRTSFPQKLLGQSKQDFVWSLHGWGGTKICLGGGGGEEEGVLGHMSKMADTTIYGKNPL